MNKAMKRIFLTISMILLVSQFTYAGAGGAGLTIGQRIMKFFSGGGDDAAEGVARAADAPAGTSNITETPTGAVPVRPGGETSLVGEPLTLQSITQAMPSQANIKGIQVIARRLSDIMMREVKSAAILVAPAGSGKTALTRGIVHLIEQKNRVVRNLQGYSVLRVDWMKITGGTEHRGQLERRLTELKAIIAENRDSKIVLVFDELEEILRDENGLKFLTSLKTEFSEDTGVKFIFNITPGPMNELMKDPQLIRRLYKLMGEVPSDQIVMEILRHMKAQAFKDHGIVISQKHLDYVMEISKRHPELGNPDGAITLLDDARIMATSDMLKGDVRVDELIQDVEHHRTIIDDILANRADGNPKYFGTFYDDLLDSKRSQVEAAEAYIKEFEDIYIATDELRIKLLDEIQKRAGYYRRSADNLTIDVDGEAVDPEILIDMATTEIARLSKQISDSSVLLQGGDLKDIHIVRTGMGYLNKTQEEIRQIIHGAPTTESLASRIIEKVNQTYEAVFSVVRRVSLKRQFRNDEGAMGVLLVSGESTRDADAFVRTMADEVTGRAPHKIAGSNIAREDKVNTQMGVTEGYAGFKEGVESGHLFKQQKLSNGNFVVHIKDPEVADTGFLDQISDIIIEGRASSNIGRNADFTDTIFAMTMKGVEALTDAQKAELANMATDLQRQDYLRALVRAKLEAEGRSIDEALLEQLYIVFTHVEDTPISNLKALVAERIRSSAMRTFFSDTFKMTMHFSDDYVDYLFNLVKEVGASRIDELVRTDVEPRILQLKEEVTIISGDNVMLDIAEDGSVIANVEVWRDPRARELAVEAARAANDLSSGVDNSVDEIDGIRRSLNE